MRSRSRASRLLATGFLPLAALLPTLACSEPQASASALEKEPSAGEAAVDAPLEAFRVELLDLAFEASSSLPLQPHVKNRSRFQEQVVATCLELDQPQRALGYIRRIDNWRRGTGYADLALHCARSGASRDVQRYLDLAHRVYEETTGEDAEAWRRDRIGAGIARTLVWLGRDEEASRIELGLADSEAGSVGVARARLVEGEALDEFLETLDAALGTAGLDQARHALSAYAELFDRFYEDEERRSWIEEKIRTGYAALPVPVRIELLSELIESALDHGNADHARELLEETRALLDGARWTAELHVPLLARLAELRHRSGDEQRARQEAAAALSMYEARRHEIADIFRADALRPVAEAQRALGDEERARETYRAAIEEGAENPNSRPRAEDLSATCCSMALHGVEPDQELWARIRAIRAGLGEPW